MDTPLSQIIENSRGMMTNALNQVQEETKLPAFLMEGIILDLLAEVRKQKNLEMVYEINKLKEKEKEGE